MLFRKIIILFLFPLSFFQLKAQNVELGMLLGGSYYYGDVVNELNTKDIRGSVMGFVRYHLTDRFCLRANLAYARIVGIDSISSNDYQRERNLNFYADLFELSCQVEYNLIQDRTRGRRIKHRAIPYIFGGLGMFYFMPKTIYNGSIYDLAALQTSGTAYSQVGFAVPLGIGIRYYLNPFWQLGFEFGARFTNTSDLDDIRGGSVYPNPADLPTGGRLVYDRSKQPYNKDTETGYGYPGRKRGYVNGNDMYFIYGITLSYKLGIVGGKRFHGRIIHCPRFY